MTSIISEINEHYIKKGKAHAKLGEFEEALKDYDKAIELNPEHSQYYEDRAEVKEKLGDIQGAKEDYAKAKELGVQK